MSLSNQLNSPKEIMIIVKKLPYALRDRFRRRTNSIQNSRNINFGDLVKFIFDEVSVLNQPLFGEISSDHDKSTVVSKRKTLATSHDKTKNFEKFCEFCKKNTNHFISSCRDFASRELSERCSFVKKHELCFACLRKSHFSKDCQNRAQCKTCQGMHPTILHDESKIKTLVSHGNEESRDSFEESRYSSDDLLDSTDREGGSKSLNSKRKHTMVSGRTLTPIVPAKIKVEGSDEYLPINCALDNCSTDCWLDEGLLPKLGVKARPTTINLSTMSNKNTKNECKVINNLSVFDMNDKFITKIPVVFSRPSKEWPLDESDVPTENEFEQLLGSHSMVPRASPAEVPLLVGMNVPELIEPLEVINSARSKSYATRHRLGWAINGPITRDGTKHYCNRIKTKTDENLESKIDNYFKQDFIDTSNEEGLSKRDTKWLGKVQNSTKKLSDNKFQISLPFKKEEVFMPNNYNQVFSIFQSTLKRISNDEEVFSEYSKFMHNMIEKGFMERVPNSELKTKPGKCWYLAHHHVYHRVKKKIRVVLNCSLKYNGLSLNDCLMQGPDLTNNLFGVLVRFRQYPIAVMADIEKMFYQVKVPYDQRDFLRLFWLDENQSIVQFRLKVHVFGATSSPSVANYALRECSKESNEDSVKHAIESNFYVDDFLCSFPTTRDAIQVSGEVRSALRGGGFNLTSFNSNSLEVLNSLGISAKTSTDSHAQLVRQTAEVAQESERERALGVIWDLSNDTIGYNICIKQNGLFTKRGILQTVASIYDPLGICSPALLKGKMVFQEACRLKVGWDSTLAADLRSTWDKWVASVTNLAQYSVPRCVSATVDCDRVELHIFVDGSESAYGTAAYLRTSSGTQHTSTLLASKGRVTPLNNSTLKTIPRVELSSAKLGVELALKLRAELSIKLDSVFYWTDSLTVLQYLSNDNLRLKRFVENKVNFILNYSTSSQWNHVPSKQNPADLVSRGATVDTLATSRLWNSGPEFLSTNEIPGQPTCLSLEVTDEEVKPRARVLLSLEEPSPTDEVMESTSQWYKLKCRIAYLLKYKEYLMKKSVDRKEVSVHDLKVAESCIIKFLQKKYFSGEIERIKLNQNLPKNSLLKRLSPILDEDGIVRVGGRLCNADLDFERKHPVILPGKTHVVELLMRDTHVKVGHMGKDAMLCHLRAKFWIIKGNSIARKIVHECLSCRKYHGMPGRQLMADLPSQRVNSSKVAFSSVGIDFFGPFYVSVGRRTEKRYGVVFSCMTTRAIHLEIAHSLNTDSFVNSLRRFICRRGNIEQVFCDNGSNLVRGQKELKLSIDEWNKQKLDDFFKQKNISWSFNPPSASHFGGHYERQIRSVRKILWSVLSEQKLRLNDENLYTIMCEAESVLNGRPLTPVSDDVTSFDALTPNHLLLFDAGVTLPPGIFTDAHSTLDRKWRQVQYLVNLFWVRWRKEYLNTLYERQKWTKAEKSLQPGDLVLVMDVLLPRNQWSMGRVETVKKDKRGFVRSAYVKVSKCKYDKGSDTSCSLILRPITKLILLQSE